VTAVVCLALAAVVAAMSSLNVALPDIAQATHATQTQLAWVTAQAGAARSSVAVAARLGGAAAAQARTAFTDGMHLALFIAAGIVAVAAVAVAVLLRGHDRVPTENTARTRVPVRSEEPEASRFAAAGRPAA
jgi:hypothetical protein